MPQGFLDDLEIGAVGAEARREAMPEHVRVDVDADDGRDHAVGQVINPAPAERLRESRASVAPLRVHEDIRGLHAWRRLRALNLLGLCTGVGDRALSVRLAVEPLDDVPVFAFASATPSSCT